MTFWEHLDTLRGTILRSIVVATLCAVVAFILKDELFAIILAPRSSAFITYRWLDTLSQALSGSPLPPFAVEMINTGLARQFMVHVKVAACAGFLCASPFILYQIFRFIAPGLYAGERRYGRILASSGYAMFILGLLISYFIIFPLTLRFLATYQVDPDIPNLISLDSYISTLLTLSLAMGVVFELPVVIWILGRLGLITSTTLRRLRRHAIVVILIAAAIITPTTDIFTLIIVALPIYLLYELSARLIPS